MNVVFESLHGAVRIEAGIIWQIRRWCRGIDGWNIQYFLTDDSASEQKRFSSILRKRLLCTVHLQSEEKSGKVH
jgi:hypothetical protein